MVTPAATKILIVDDDRFLLDMYALKFAEHGYQIETSFNAAEALQKLDHGFVPDICLIDVIMPGMDGFELIKELKKRQTCAHSLMIILSNLGQQDDIDKGLQIGADGYIVKASATPSEVIQKVKTIADQKKSR